MFGATKKYTEFIDPIVFATCKGAVHLDIADQQAKKINAMPTWTCGETDLPCSGPCS